MEETMHKAAEIIKDYMEKLHIHLTEVSFASFLFQTYVALERMRNGHYIELNSGAFSGARQKEIDFVKQLLVALQEEFHFEAPEEEAYYLLIYLLAARRSGDVPGDETNFVIHEDIDHC